MSVESIQLTALSKYPWHAEQVRGGTVYWDSDPAPQIREAADFARSLAVGYQDLPSEPLAKGTTSTMYRVGGLVIKRFDVHEPPYFGEESGLPYLQVSDGLNRGLVHIQKYLLPENQRRRDDVTFAYAAPRFYGGFIPNGRDRRPFSVMAFSPGEDPKNPDMPRLPSSFRRHRVYENALAAAGLKGSLARAIGAQNTLVRRSSDSTATITRVAARSWHPNLQPVTRLSVL